MTVSELKYAVEQAETAPYFFTRKAMKFFGDTIRNYGVRSYGEYWELYRKRPVKYGLDKSHYFHKVTFKETTNLPEKR